jgi:hypothetical protein
VDVGGVEGRLAIHRYHPVTGEGASVIVSRKHSHGELGVAVFACVLARQEAASVGRNDILRWNRQFEEPVKLRPFLALETLRSNQGATSKRAKLRLRQAQEKRDIHLRQDGGATVPGWPPRGIKWLPKAFGTKMEKRKADIGLGSPTTGNNSPIGAEAESKISILSEKRSTELTLLGKIADDQKQQWLLRRDPKRGMSLVWAQRAHALKPACPFRGCRGDNLVLHLFLAKLWSAAACCRFVSGQLAGWGHAGSEIAASELAAC